MAFQLKMVCNKISFIHDFTECIILGQIFGKAILACCLYEVRCPLGMELPLGPHHPFLVFLSANYQKEKTMA